MSRIFCVSDFHFQHTKILEYQARTRPFQSLEEMHEILVFNFNSTVQPEDKVFLLGDFSFGNYETAKYYLELLNGYKILVRGNHDRSKARMLEMGFNEVYDYEGLELTADVNGKSYTFTLSHFPYNVSGLPEKDNERTYLHKYYPKNMGNILLHGHLHSSPENKIKKGFDLEGKEYIMYDVGVDANSCKPISLEEIISQLGI